MKKYIAGFGIASAIAWFGYKILDDQLQISWRINNFLRGNGA